MRRFGIVLLVGLLATACSSGGVSRQLGAQCTNKGDCEERCLTGGDYPDGLCSQSCAVDDECPDSSACVDKEGGVCLYTCQNTGDCEFLGPGWQCEPVKRREKDSPEVSICIGG